MVPSIYTTITYFFWAILAIVWFIGFFGNKKTLKITNWSGQIIVFILLYVGFGLLFTPRLQGSFLNFHLLQSNIITGYTGIIFVFLGAAFAIWARVTLGKNWSGAVVTLKKDHSLIQNGPYKIVRNPIYTGLLLAALGTSLTIGLVSGFAGCIFLAVAFIIRIYQEEKVMMAEFPNEYPSYKIRVKALIPFVI